MSQKEIIIKHFSLQVQFVKKNELMPNEFSYTTTISNIKIDVTPCGKYLMVHINN